MTEYHNYEEYEKDELEVGMEVYYGWGDVFRYPIWAKRIITALTPKKTKITLDNGHVIHVEKRINGYHTKLYRCDSNTEVKSDILKILKDIQRDINVIANADFSKMKDEDLRYAAFSLHEATSVLQKGKDETGRKE